jgi:hypothetical protein
MRPDGGDELMAGNPRIVTENVEFSWDGATAHLAKGQMLDVTPGSALERAIGEDKLRPPGPIAAAPPPPAAPAALEPPAKPALVAAKPEGVPEAAPKKTTQATAKLTGTEGKEAAS